MTELEKRGPGRPRKVVETPAGGDAEPVRQRPARKPFGSMQQKLAYPERPGYHRHWFNDSPGRIIAAHEAGYEHVKDNEGKPVSRIVGTAEGGGPLVAFIMEIPQEWYDEDMGAQKAERDEKMASIKNPVVGDKTYVGKEGISFKDSVKHGIPMGPEK